MARAPKALRIVYPETQNYACRDCPARCCRTPWGIPVSPEVALVVLEDPELRPRLVGRAPGILASGTLPMREHDGQLQCVFLEDDLLCGLQKRHGHQALPQACQAYPFGFMKNEAGDAVALLSRHCPSIRDNYGEPLGPQIREKLEQAGGARTLAPRMGLQSGKTLTAGQYTSLVDTWKQLFLAGSPLVGLSRAYAELEAFDAAWASSGVEDGVPGAVETVRQSLEVAPLPHRRRPAFAARLFFAHQLGNLSYPSRVLMPFAVSRPGIWQRLRSYGNKLAWLLGRGRVDLLYVTGRVPLGRIDSIPPFLSGPWGELVGSYLAEVLERRQAFVRQTYLSRVLVDLGLMAVLVSRFARASAAGHGRVEVAKADVLEGIGVADLLVAHQADVAQSAVLSHLRLQLMSDPGAFRRFLASETDPR
jgi:lysine-N-methylase